MGYKWAKEKMKKTILMLVAIIAISVSVFAEYAQCTIAGSDGATATVSIGYYNGEKGTVSVTFSNDSDKPATICCKLKTNTGVKGSGCAMVPPRSEVTKDIQVSEKPTSIEVSSARCQ